MKRQKIKIHGTSDLEDEKIIIEVGDPSDINAPFYAEDAEKICKVLLESIPGGTFDLVFEFLKKFQRKGSMLYIDDAFNAYWEKKKKA